MVYDLSYKIKILAADVIAVNLAFFMASMIRFTDNIPYEMNYAFFAAFVTVVYAGAIYFNRMLDKRRLEFMDISYRIFKTVTVASFAIAAIAYFDWTFRLPRTIIILTWLLSLVYLTAAHYILRPKSEKENASLVVGAKKGMVNLLRNTKYNIIGFVDDKIKNPVDNKPILGSFADITKLIESYKIKTIIFAMPKKDNEKILDIIMECRDFNVDFKVVPNLYEYVLASETEEQLVSILVRPANTFYQVLKRVLDTIISLFFIIILSPLMLIIAIIIKMDSRGPVLFKQRRQARFGRTFKIMKFRSMVNDAEKKTGPLITTHKTIDPRHTKVGRFLRRTHLDEIPQLFNILRGDMSFVGPRPERPVFSRELNKKIKQWNQRLYIRPGLTGLAQIEGIGSLDAEKKIQKDLYYIKNISLLLDMKIMLRTMIKVLKNK